ncbi:hypothetical protein F2Q70_00019275 [Brassica cretica]|uniref:Uncharacterized protein n=1 Tax=Brassica cretica TaxID=69181 RepID=A0A8S9GT18_BRACR|nr:hypothetical protein F2Q70_00019275 [Brassica cretica]
MGSGVQKKSSDRSETEILRYETDQLSRRRKNKDIPWDLQRDETNLIGGASKLINHLPLTVSFTCKRFCSN